MNTFAAAATALRADNWLITAEGFELLSEAIDVKSLAALSASDKQKSESQTDGPEKKRRTAILPVIGPLATYNNFISRALGWTTYQSLASDLANLEADSSVSEIMLYMDTPGGATKGISEACHALKRGNTKVSAYVAGTCASAGYWLASQCSSIAAAPDAIIGSIGVRIQYYVPASNELTSKYAPRKNMAQTVAQALIDDLEALFLEDVAAGRGVSTDTIKGNYGKGGVMTAGNALKAGMIDSVSLFDSYLEGTNDDEIKSEVDGWDELYAEISQDSVTNDYSGFGRRFY